MNSALDDMKVVTTKPGPMKKPLPCDDRSPSSHTMKETAGNTRRAISVAESGAGRSRACDFDLLGDSADIKATSS
jgi:hypothetical protein